jgi:GDPmannose 4,6-dehydratase
MRPADVTYQIPSSRKFEAATGWKPEIALKDSVAHLLEHCRAQVGARAERQTVAA